MTETFTAIARTTRCFQCAAVVSDIYKHDCPFDNLLAAIGDIELTPAERASLRWIAGFPATAQNLAAIIERVTK